MTRRLLCLDKMTIRIARRTVVHSTKVSSGRRDARSLRRHLAPSRRLIDPPFGPSPLCKGAASECGAPQHTCRYIDRLKAMRAERNRKTIAARTCPTLTRLAEIVDGTQRLAQPIRALVCLHVGGILVPPTSNIRGSGVENRHRLGIGGGRCYHEAAGASGNWTSPLDAENRRLTADHRRRRTWRKPHALTEQTTRQRGGDMGRWRSAKVIDAANASSDRAWEGHVSIGVRARRRRVVVRTDEPRPRWQERDSSAVSTRRSGDESARLFVRRPPPRDQEILIRAVLVGWRRRGRERDTFTVLSAGLPSHGRGRGRGRHGRRRECGCRRRYCRRRRCSRRSCRRASAGCSGWLRR